MRHLGICIRSKLKLENVAKDILRSRDFFLIKDNGNQTWLVNHVLRNMGGLFSNLVALSEYIDCKEKAALLKKEQNAVCHKFSNSFFQGKQVPV